MVGVFAEVAVFEFAAEMGGRVVEFAAEYASLAGEDGEEQGDEGDVCCGGALTHALLSPGHRAVSFAATQAKCQYATTGEEP
ncbi:hypothetical protein ACIQNU_03035 [Streptomyces sp. NPDC091292]|uniref:hypothetical protein n=1 Tax=Streptomyces sp. NPDC091292 TaxID=3365991 RepID=UPI0037F27724